MTVLVLAGLNALGAKAGGALFLTATPIVVGCSVISMIVTASVEWVFGMNV
tara:strand:+ start:2429 stop:2581 length:153 start_codon:yes stop_codon:yes gene_type:complete